MSNILLQHNNEEQNKVHPGEQFPLTHYYLLMSNYSIFTNLDSAS